MSPQPDEPPRILLVEDNETTSKTLRLFLESTGYEVGCAFDGRSGLDYFRRGCFHLVVLDLMLPDMDGLELCREIRRTSEIPIVMLTARVSEDDIVEGLESGADDYVCKPFGSKELMARIGTCLRRSSGSADWDASLRVGELLLDEERRRVELRGEGIDLTKSEFAILQTLMGQPGRVFTRGQLIEAALGPHFDGFERTVDTHVWSLRKKLGESGGSPRYILSELGVGYRMRDDETG